MQPRSSFQHQWLLWHPTTTQKGSCPSYAARLHRSTWILWEVSDKVTSDEEWLPDVKDLISGNFNVLIDLTRDSGSEVCHHVDGNQMITGTDFGGTQRDAVFSGRDLRTDSGTALATPPPIRLEPSPFGNRPLGANQPSQAVDSLGSEEMEIPESPSTVRVSPAASVKRHHNDRDSSEGPTATAAVTQIIPPHTEVEDQPEGQKQGQEEPDSSGGDLPSSRQPVTP